MEHSQQPIQVLVDRHVTHEGYSIYRRICDKITVRKNDSNSFSYGLRVFTVPQGTILGFPSNQWFRLHYGQYISAVYIFRFHNVANGAHTHAIYVRLNGFVHRRIFDGFVNELVKTFIGEYAELRAIVTNIKKSMSLCDYLSTLYVVPQNLIVNFSHQHDAVAEAQRIAKQNNNATAILKNRMCQISQLILDNMIAMPSNYEGTYLHQLLTMNTMDFRKHMRTTNMDEINMRVGNEAYNRALQDPKFKHWEVQELMDPITRRSMLNRCVSTQSKKHIQLLLQQTYGIAFVHPHPYNGIIRSDLHHLRPLDGMLFDPRFLFSVLMVSRWFARACMLEDNRTSNNQAHLLLYGGAGTGKTLLVSSISSCIATYKFLAHSGFQNPDMLDSALFSIDEFDVSELPNNTYKQLLDLKTHMKINFKNMHPENVSEGVPCMMTTNDEVFSVLRSQKKYNSSSVAAALRRVYIVPMKAGSFEKMHGRVPQESPFHRIVGIHDPRFQQESEKIRRIFNLIFGFAMFQEDMTGLYLEPRLHAFFEKMAYDFNTTAFGTFYLSQKAKVDAIIAEVEDSMMADDLDDSSYLVKISTCVGQFQQLLYQFLDKMLEDNDELESQVIREKSVPWPVKTYYFLSNLKFTVKLMWQVADYKALLNPEIKAFIQDSTIKPYRLAEPAQLDPIFADLRDPFDSVDEEEGQQEGRDISFVRGGAGDGGKAGDIYDMDVESMIQRVGSKRSYSPNDEPEENDGVNQLKRLNSNQL